MNLKWKQHGLTLIELMIALALGLFLSAGIVALYIQSKDSFWQDEELARIQENGRYATQLLIREVRMAGFMGGVEKPQNITNPASISVGNDCDTDWALDAAIPLEIVDDASADLSGTYGCFTTDMVADTDVLAVKRVLDEAIVDNGLWHEGYSSLVADRIYMRSENRGLGLSFFATASDIPKAGDIVSPGNEDAVRADPSLGTQVNIWEYDVSLFHVAENPQGIPSLARYNLDSSGDISDREFLVEGIEDIQYELGIDTDGDGQPERFVAASTDPPDASAGSEQLGDVAAVKIYVLARSLQAQANEPARAMTYKLGSKTITTNDNIQRRVFSSTAMLRNPVYVID
jgi:type IV pilus assembly protein PilW